MNCENCLDFSQRPEECRIEYASRVDDNPFVQKLKDSNATEINLHNCEVSDVILSRVRKWMKNLNKVDLGNADLRQLRGMQLCKLAQRKISIEANEENRYQICYRVNEYYFSVIHRKYIKEEEKKELLSYPPFYRLNDWSSEQYENLLNISDNTVRRTPFSSLIKGNL